MSGCVVFSFSSIFYSLALNPLKPLLSTYSHYPKVLLVSLLTIWFSLCCRTISVVSPETLTIPGQIVCGLLFPFNYLSQSVLRTNIWTAVRTTTDMWDSPFCVLRYSQCPWNCHFRHRPRIKYKFSAKDLLLGVVSRKDLSNLLGSLTVPVFALHRVPVALRACCGLVIGPRRKERSQPCGTRLVADGYRPGTGQEFSPRPLWARCSLSARFAMQAEKSRCNLYRGRTTTRRASAAPSGPACRKCNAYCRLSRPFK